MATFLANNWEFLKYTQLFHNKWTKFRTGVIFISMCALHLNMSSSELFFDQVNFANLHSAFCLIDRACTVTTYLAASCGSKFWHCVKKREALSCKFHLYPHNCFLSPLLFLSLYCLLRTVALYYLVLSCLVLYKSWYQSGIRWYWSMTPCGAIGCLLAIYVIAKHHNLLNLWNSVSKSQQM